MEKIFKPGDKIVGKTTDGKDLATHTYNSLGVCGKYFIAKNVIYDENNDRIYLDTDSWRHECFIKDIRHYSEFEDDYQNVLDIEVGDTVRCISENKSEFKDYAGGGWEKGLEFKVSRVNNHYDYKLYFGGKNGNGVYSDAVRLVKKFNPLKDNNVEITNLVGKPELFEIGDWYKFTWNTGVSMYGRCDKIRDDLMHFKEVIQKSGSNSKEFEYVERAGMWNIKRPISIVTADMNEIFPYLSMKEEKPKDASAFILGQWYKIIWYKYPLIEQYGHTCYIKIKGIDYKKNVIYFEEGIIKDKYGKFLGEIDIADAFITEANYEAEYLNDFILDLVLNKPLTPKDVFKKDDTPIAMGKGILNQVELNNEPTEKYKGKSKNSKQYNLIIIKVSKEKLIKK